MLKLRLWNLSTLLRTSQRPATLKYRAEDEMLEAFVARVRKGSSGLNGLKKANEAFIGC